MRERDAGPHQRHPHDPHDPPSHRAQAYCRSKNLPTELEQRGVKFLDSKHRSQQIIDARATVQDMPPSLQDDIFWASVHFDAWLYVSSTRGV